jgi:hypothetical protein
MPTSHIMHDTAEQRVQLQISGGGSGIPRGVRKTRCRHCGRRAWLARIHPDMAAGRRRMVVLDPWPRPGRGAVALTRDELAVFTGKVPADYSIHRCPAKITKCKHCGLPVRVLLLGPDAAEQLAVVEASPAGDGVVVIDRHGHAVPNPAGAMPGERFRWHVKHGRAETEMIMRQIPGGQR